MQGRILRCVERVLCGTPASTSRSKSERSRLYPLRPSTESSYTCEAAHRRRWGRSELDTCGDEDGKNRSEKLFECWLFKYSTGERPYRVRRKSGQYVRFQHL
jgi:hypothetical protein